MFLCILAIRSGIFKKFKVDSSMNQDSNSYLVTVLSDSFNLLVNNGAAAGQVIFHVSNILTFLLIPEEGSLC